WPGEILADRIAVRPELAREPAAHDDHRWRVLVVMRREAAAEQDWDPHHVEEVRRHRIDGDAQAELELVTIERAGSRLVARMKDRHARLEFLRRQRRAQRDAGEPGILRAAREHLLVQGMPP